MSDPVSNSEIEDVLASIRRLVSENAKALKGDRQRDPEAEKLVLTPALRIDDSEDPSQPADVFAVDTDTWNDVSRKAEHAENAGVFSHKAQPPSAVVEGAAAADAAAAASADSGEAAGDADAGEPLFRAARGSAAMAQGAEVADAPEAAPETAPTSLDAPESVALDPTGEDGATAGLEQRIADLETALERTESELAPESTAAPGIETEAGQGDEAETSAASAGAAPVSDAAPEPMAEPEAEPASETAATIDAEDDIGQTIDAPAQQRAPEAPPRSWIEGLVAAAAAAEAARLADRALERGMFPQKAQEVTEGAAPEDVADTAVTEPGDAGPDGTEETAAELHPTNEETPPEALDEAREDYDTGSEPFALTAAHAAAAEEVAEAAIPAPDAQEMSSEITASEGPDEIVAEAAIAEEEPETAVQAAEETPASVEETDQESAQPAVEAADAAEPAAAGTTGPERSWVDRLMAAAASLRGAPEDARTETADETPAAGAETEAAAEAPSKAQDDAGAGEDTPAAIADEAVAAGDEPEAAALEPLSLVDPVAPEAEVAEAAETGDETEAVEPAATLEWEPVNPAETVEASAADAEPDAVVDVDRVLTGPWTARVADAAPTTAEPSAEPSADEGQAEPEPASSVAPLDTAAEVPVGALEWEPVDRAETDAAETETGDQSTEAEAEALTTGAEPLAAAEPDMADIAQIADDSEAEETDFAQAGDADDGEDAAADLDAGASEPEVETETVQEALDEAASEDLDGADEASDWPEPESEPEPVRDADEAVDDLDADAAAVAAAAEAEADWDDVGMAAAAGVALAAPAPSDETREPETATADRAGRAVGDDEAVIDEAMLRELVAQLVRDELQGAVGERITHNVRKLIRREIARALTLQDFEK